MKIEKSQLFDHVELTELTKVSKAYWGYSQKQIEKWDKFLTISKEYILDNEVYKLVVNYQIIGYYSFFKVDDKKVKLDYLFILPEFIGKRLGVFLMNDLFKRVDELGFSIVTLDSEPNSKGFYKKLGFKVVGKKETSIKNRFMPIMEINLQLKKRLY